MGHTLHLRRHMVHTLRLRIHTPHLHMLHLQVNAWIFNSKDSVAGNCKTGNSFWGQIAATFNSTSDPARRRTSKQLKDHWNAYNKEVSLFNAYHIQEEARSTAPLVVRNEAKWKGQHGPGSGTDSTSKRSRQELVSTALATTTEEERPTGRDRAKAAARKDRRKGKESSSSSEVGSKSFAMKNMWNGLVKAKLLKQWNKMKDRSTADMNEAEKRKHAKAIQMVENELGLEDDADEEEEED
ncbi:hypothetical protein QYE76_047107 [Lolium multiflorum]|uniref:Myb-like domain-containing protein n=1 Tax=Lolium multiflorum TaxID=4521 RepID=A0AAD8TN85_LOLMU|nr:hypothetical protein QYE76_047107 [Lolium multiflorum]